MAGNEGDEGADGSRKAPLSPRDAALGTLARTSGHGLTFALSTIFFFGGGWWIDGKLGTRPLFAILGGMLGAGAGFYHILQHLVFFPREAQRRRAEEVERERMEKDPAG